VFVDTYVFCSAKNPRLVGGGGRSENVKELTVLGLYRQRIDGAITQLRVTTAF
jgi:hypothetical protein